MCGQRCAHGVVELFEAHGNQGGGGVDPRERETKRKTPMVTRPVSTTLAVFTLCREVEWEILHEALSMGMAAEEDRRAADSEKERGGKTER